MFKLSEILPVESVGPLLGGIAVWFGLNYLVIGPELIGPRLAEKYYVPACVAAVADGRQARAQETEGLRAIFERDLRARMEGVQRQVQTQGNAFLGALFGGQPGGQELANRLGGSMGAWTNNLAAPALLERVQAERLAFASQVEQRDAALRRSIVYKAPPQFCGCVVAEGLKDRIELAAFTSTLRLYTPASVRKLADGTMLHDVKSCGAAPVV